MDMEQAWAAAVKFSCVVGGVLLSLMGGWDAPLEALVILMGVDYAAGLLVAFSGRSGKTPLGGFSSAVCFRGLTKKLMVMLILIMAVMLDRLVGIQAFRIAVMCFYAANEGLSILENAAIMGLPLPETLKKALEDLKKKKIPIGNETEDKRDD